MTDITILTAAESALAAGLCPIRAKADGSKAPFGQWKRYQSERPDLADVVTWFTDWPNLGLVCGEVSDRLVCLEFEGRFMDRLPEVRAALTAADLWSVFDGWLQGYSELTPSGGLHVLVHVGGDHRLDGNRKIALDVQGAVTIETRGEGGFVITAPSNGSTHPTGGAWRVHAGSFESIAWVDPGEWDAVCSVLACFDETPAGPVVPRRPVSSGSAGWVDDAIDHGPQLASVLLEHGWRFVGEAAGRSLWRRPGKERGSISATMRMGASRDWLYVHSTNAHPVPDSSTLGGQTFDVVDVIGCYELGRLPTWEERPKIAARWAPPRGRAGSAGQATEVAETSDAATYLPDEFWQAQPWLGRIREVALQRMIAPEALLGAFLSAWSAMIPPGLVLPEIVVSQAPLNAFVTLVGASGGGKTGANSIAQRLLGFNQEAHADIRMGESLRSGEGLVTLALRPQSKKAEEETGPVYRHAVQLIFDEGTGMSAQADRLGSTLLPWLCTIWAGSRAMVGGAKAAGREGFPANRVRFSMLTSTQPGAASSLFMGEAQRLGFPQRLHYFATDNPVVREQEVTDTIYPAVQPLGLPIYRAADFRVERPVELGFPPDIWREVRSWHQHRGSNPADDSYDGHRMNLRMRIAGLMALARQETIVVTDEDWALATRVEEHSRSVRGSLISSFLEVSRYRAFQQGRLDAARDEGRVDAWVTQRATRIARWIHETQNPDGVTLKDCKGRLANKERANAREIMAYAETYNWVIHRDGRYFVGAARPV